MLKTDTEGGGCVSADREPELTAGGSVRWGVAFPHTLPVCADTSSTELSEVLRVVPFFILLLSWF